MSELGRNPVSALTAAISLALVVAAITPAAGQDDLEVRIGGSAGMGASSLWNEAPNTVYTYHFRPGARFGVSSLIDWNGPVQVQVEATLAQQGAVQEVHPEQTGVAHPEFRLRFTYLRAPLLLRAPIDLPLTNQEIRLYGGPHLAVPLRFRAEVRPRSPVQEATIHLPEGVPPLDVGMTVGAEVPVLEAASVDWAVMGRYGLGFRSHGQSKGEVYDGLGSSVRTAPLRSHGFTFGIVAWL